MAKLITDQDVDNVTIIIENNKLKSVVPNDPSKPAFTLNDFKLEGNELVLSTSAGEKRVSLAPIIPNVVADRFLSAVSYDSKSKELVFTISQEGATDHTIRVPLDHFVSDRVSAEPFNTTVLLSDGIHTPGQVTVTETLRYVKHPHPSTDTVVSKMVFDVSIVSTISTQLEISTTQIGATIKYNGVDQGSFFTLDVEPTSAYLLTVEAEGAFDYARSGLNIAYTGGKEEPHIARVVNPSPALTHHPFRLDDAYVFVSTDGAKELTPIGNIIGCSYSTAGVDPSLTEANEDYYIIGVSVLQKLLYIPRQADSVQLVITGADSNGSTPLVEFVSNSNPNVTKHSVGMQGSKTVVTMQFSNPPMGEMHQTDVIKLKVPRTANTQNLKFDVFFKHNILPGVGYQVPTGITVHAK